MNGYVMIEHHEADLEEIKQLKERLVKQNDLFVRLEWAADLGFSCPSCSGARSTGHKRGCELLEVIQ